MTASSFAHRTSGAAILALGLCCSAFANAAGLPASKVYADAASTFSGGPSSTVATLGVVLPSESLSRWIGGDALSARWDVFASHWRVPGANAPHHHYTQVGALGMLRHDLSGALAPWFLEAGFGITLFDGTYDAYERRFSTRLQFTQALALGWRFGPKQAYEVSLRAQHISNGSIKKPNPGENLLRVRLAIPF